MASGTLKWSGLDEFKRQLRDLPADLRASGDVIVTASTEKTKTDTVTNYPEVSGNLRKGVGTKYERSAYGIIGTVTSRAYHAHLYERGSRRQPPAPPGKRLGTHAARNRRQMYKDLAAMMRAAGLEVSGDV